MDYPNANGQTGKEFRNGSTSVWHYSITTVVEIESNEFYFFFPLSIFLCQNDLREQQHTTAAAVCRNNNNLTNAICLFYFLLLCHNSPPPLGEQLRSHSLFFWTFFFFLLHLILLIVRRATDGPTGCLHLYISSLRTNKTAVFTCCCFVIFRVSMPGVKSTPQRLFWLFFNPPRICSVYLHTNVSADILSRSLFLTVSPLSLFLCVYLFFPAALSLY